MVFLCCISANKAHRPSVGSMLARVADGGPALNQHLVNVWFSLRCRLYGSDPDGWSRCTFLLWDVEVIKKWVLRVQKFLLCGIKADVHGHVPPSAAQGCVPPSAALCACCVLSHIIVNEKANNRFNLFFRLCSAAPNIVDVIS